MVRRNLRSDFVGGAYVFPGGGVDLLDGGPEAEAVSAGRTDAGASTLLGFDSGGLAYWVAVVRETFEEAGPSWPGARPAPTCRPATRGGGALRCRSSRGQRRARAASSTSAATRACASRSATSTTSPTGSPRAARRGATTPGSSWPRPPPARSRRTTPARPSPRCGSRRTTRWPVTAPARSRSSSPPSATSRPSAASTRARRSWRRPRRHRAPSRRSSRGSCPTATGCASCCRATRLRAGRGPRPRRRQARGDFNEAVRAVSMRANEEGPDTAPGPRPAGDPASRDPGGARLRHRPRPGRAGSTR